MKKLSIALVGIALLASVVACGGGGEAPAPSQPAASAPAADAAPAESSAPAATGTAPVEPGTASVTGTITYEGDVPNLKPVEMSADPKCQAKHSEPVPAEMLVLGDQNTLGNVFVYVKSGLPEGQWPAPAEAAVIDQNGCLYKPHVLGVVAGQQVKFLNSDGILHNVHALPEVNREFNKAMPGEVTESTESFDKVEDFFRIKCDVHPWMNAFVRVMRHPYFDTTVEDGVFSIEGLPAGTYEIEAWHERLGAQSMEVTVAEGETATADMTLSR